MKVVIFNIYLGPLCNCFLMTKDYSDRLVRQSQYQLLFFEIDDAVSNKDARMIEIN